jgi:hypothetical protein
MGRVFILPTQNHFIDLLDPFEWKRHLHKKARGLRILREQCVAGFGRRGGLKVKYTPQKDA